jgi:prevent-host-death family protein
MKTIAAAKFKERCLALLDDLDADGLVITKHGKPVAKVVPYERQSASLIGSLKGKIEIRGDILSTGGAWDADAQS